MLKDAVSALKAQKAVLLVDDGSELLAAYIMAPASTITKETVCLLVNKGGGVVCVALSAQRVESLGLPPMSKAGNPSTMDFLVSVEARKGVSTGISAADRALTIKTLANTNDARLDLVMPGHVFPVRAKKGGTLVRCSPAEAAVDLMALAKQQSEAVALSHCLSDTGEMLGKEEIDNLASENSLPLVYASEVIQERLKSETIIERVAQARLPLAVSDKFETICFRSTVNDAEHLAIYIGELENQKEPPLVRVQAEDRLGDLIGYGSSSADMIKRALQRIESEGRGLFVYIRHPRKGLLSKKVEKLKNSSQASPEIQGGNSNPANLREVGVGSQIINSFGLNKIRILSNAEKDLSALATYGIEISEQVKF